MTIQIPNPGTGNGATGDNELVLWNKVKNNFENQTHAASRTVGVNPLDVMTVAAFGFSGELQASLGDMSDFAKLKSELNKKTQFFRTSSASSLVYRYAASMFIQTSDTATCLTADIAGAGVRLLTWNTAMSAPIIYDLRTSRNTTTDANGFIKSASPIVKVFADKIELNDDAIDQDVTFIKNGIGDYTIKTISGLSTDGWYLELPKDLNGNPKVAVTLSESNGTINLKSYKRIFSMETFTFTPDLDQPLDIPDGRWIDLRLNEIEMPDILPEA